jgi:hypothetical protein
MMAGLAVALGGLIISLVLLAVVVIMFWRIDRDWKRLEERWRNLSVGAEGKSGRGGP